MPTCEGGSVRCSTLTWVPIRLHPRGEIGTCFKCSDTSEHFRERNAVPTLGGGCRKGKRVVGCQCAKCRKFMSACSARTSATLGATRLFSESLLLSFSNPEVKVDSLRIPSK